MTKFATCKCGIVIDTKYLNGRSPTEAMMDHLENDHPAEVSEIFIAKNYSIIFDIFYSVTKAYRNSKF